ncbi:MULTISPECIES: hypothetical protein [Streptomyces]|uniref:hypothetical protein n=1 Tax=Streptomyces TaxID=1883 RepID=UPI001E3B848A|nr:MULTISPECIES: hypothetical protein [Streptomyces]UFQ16874.1 hypothetical protein J2N69_18755 [Streptomyces huasconensis]WCL86477.1 hypothetical protein PPN52_18760 [Streptomyces sp. JCM 35825]
MRMYIGDQEAATVGELIELAGGVDIAIPRELHELFFSEDTEDDFRDLFLGSRGETDEQRRSRELVAREVLSELLEAGRDDEIERMNAAYAAQLVVVANLRKQINSPRLRKMQKAA